MEKPDFEAAYDLIVTLNMINEGIELMNIIFDTNYNDKSYIEKLRADWLKIANGTAYEDNIKVFDLIFFESERFVNKKSCGKVHLTYWISPLG